MASDPKGLGEDGAAICGWTWADTRMPWSRRGVGHDDGQPEHRCCAPPHGTSRHRCSCGAMTVHRGAAAPIADTEDRDPMGVTCPVCGAALGERCISQTVVVRKKHTVRPHEARIQATRASGHSGGGHK